MPAFLRKIEEESDEPGTTIEELTAIPLEKSEPEKIVLVGALLPEPDREELMEILRQNRDVFAWSREDIPGIDPSHACHRLNIDPNFPPVKQKPRRFAPEKNNAINKEVGKLLENDLIRECVYPQWVSNLVVVKKKNGDDRTCIDFTNLNKACPRIASPCQRSTRWLMRQQVSKG